MKKFLFGIFCILSGFVYSQSFDPSFNPRILGAPTISHTAEAADGGLLISGNVDYANGQETGSLLKIKRDGTVADEFKVFTDYPIAKVVVLPDGKILIQGGFSRVNGIDVKHFARLNSDGTLDQSFNSQATIEVGDFALQSDGKIIVSSKFIGFDFKLQRLNTDGSLDETFNSPVSGIGTIVNLLVGPTDEIFISNPEGIIKYLPSGDLDPDFQVTIDFNSSSSLDQFNSIAVQPDGKSLLALGSKIIRLNQNGSVDSTFSLGEGILSSGAQSALMMTRKNGNILLSGNFWKAVEVSSTGAYVAQYPVSGAMALAIELSDKKIFVTGPRPTLLDSIGNPDPVFAPIQIAAAPIFGTNDMLVSFKNKLIFANGRSDWYHMQPPIIQLNADGKTDSSFQCALDPNSSVMTLALQEDGKILAGGWINYAQRVVRLEQDGSIDESFNTGDLGSIGIERILFNGSGILVAGQFDHFAGVATTSIVILNKDGSVSKTFSGLPPESQVVNFDYQSDGKLVVIGVLKFQDQLYGCARLNADGTLDDSFPKLPFDNYFTLKVDTKDRIYLGGYMQFDRIRRLNPDGSKDDTFTGTAFTHGGGKGFSISTIEFLPTGELMVGGGFTEYNGEVCNGVVILKEDGSYSFPPGLNASSYISRIKYGQGCVFIGGRLSFDDSRKVIGVGKIILNTSTFLIPSNPNALLGNLKDETSIELNWSCKSGLEDGFEIERSDDTPYNFVTNKTLYRKNNSFIDSGIDPNKKYFYRVRAFNAKGGSAYSNVYAYPDDSKVTAVKGEVGVGAIYPNPINDVAIIQIDGPIVEITITDQLGRRYKYESIVCVEELAQVGVTNLPDGLYIFSVQTEKSSFRLKAFKK